VLSLDLGTRVGVLDKNTDARHLDRPSVLVGGSVNPFYFIRLSAGMYVFENAQTDDRGGVSNQKEHARVIYPLVVSIPRLNRELRSRTGLKLPVRVRARHHRKRLRSVFGIIDTMTPECERGCDWQHSEQQRASAYTSRDTHRPSH
jgi:hypothetical protein